METNDDIIIVSFYMRFMVAGLSIMCNLRNIYISDFIKAVDNHKDNSHIEIISIEGNDKINTTVLTNNRNNPSIL